MTQLRTFVMLAALSIASFSYGQQIKTEGLPMKLGDSVAQVQAAFQTKTEPDPYDSPTSKGGVVLRLRTKGVWAFFNKDGKATTIRLESPFKGNVAGVKVGDTLSSLKKRLGEPVKPPFKFGANEALIYYPDDSYSARFDINESGSVETIFISK